MKTQLKTMAALLLAALLACGSGCQKETPDNGGNNNGNENGGGNGGGNNGGGNSGGGTDEGMYVGVIGFNDVLKTKNISLLNGSTEDSFTDFIGSLTMDDNTALYYADNTALNWLQSATLPSDIINVSLLTFTDGLDNASLMLDDSYASQDAYLNAINTRILNERIKGKSINAYSIGLRGNNVINEQDFQQKLRKLASNNNNVYLADNMDMVIQRFREIASQLYNEITTVNTNVKIPGGYDNNTTIRLTFDDVSNANNSTRYIQAVFSRENGKGKLSNVTYYGLQSTSGNSIISSNQEGASYWYMFSELKTSNGLQISNLQNMKLWIYTSSGWRPEDEFTPASYTNTSVTRKSAVAVLVLDCTTSLGNSDFRKMKDAAVEFITTLNSNSGGGNEGGSGSGGNGGGVDTQTYTITTSAEPTNGGSVTGSGNYNEGASVTLRANANTNYTFDRWQDGNTTNPRTITVISNATYTAYFTYSGEGSGNGTANGHAYVDLGLPSGTLWATCNVGAYAPEDPGDFFSWGETEPKNDYSWKNYKFCHVTNVVLLTKYCDNSSNGYNGFTDNLISLLLEDDAARANWGDGWRMPTVEEWEELKNNTTYTWITHNGVNGLLFTASNGNSIFLPATGIFTGSSNDNEGNTGMYWSCSLSSGYPEYSNVFDITNVIFISCGITVIDRGRGLTVRAVLSASRN